MSGTPTTCVWPVSATAPTASVLAAARKSSALRPSTSSSLASGLFGLVMTAMVGPVIDASASPAGASCAVANTTALVAGIVSRLVGKLAPLYEASSPNHDATVPAACSTGSEGCAEN